MSLTNYLEHAVLDYVFGGTSFTPSGTLYIGLSTTTPTESGTNFTEPSSPSGYSRVPITNNKSNWSTASQLSTSGEIHNLSAVTFGTASGNWGTVTHAGLFDTVSGGNLLIFAELSTNKTPTAGDVLNFPSGAISIRID